MFERFKRVEERFVSFFLSFFFFSAREDGRCIEITVCTEERGSQGPGVLELNFVDNCRNNEKSFHTLTKMKNYYIGEYLGKTGKMLKYLAHGDLIKWKKCGKDCDLAHW